MKLLLKIKAHEMPFHDNSRISSQVIARSRLGCPLIARITLAGDLGTMSKQEPLIGDGDRKRAPFLVLGLSL